MSRALALMATLVLATAALAGCTRGDDGQPTTTTTTTTPATTTPVTTTTPPVGTNETENLTNESFVVSTSGIPGQAKPGQAFSLNVTVNGTVSYVTDHVGAHYANNTTSELVATAMGACEHGAGTLPGTFTTNCTLAEQGTWYVYGHARGVQGNVTYNWWAEPVAVKVRDYGLNITTWPQGPQTANTNFSVLLAINGTDNVTSDHIGIVYFNSTTGEPTLASAAGVCEHKTAAVIDTHSLNCQVPNQGTAPRTVFLRGHLRVTEGGVTLEWWSAPREVTILPALPI